MGNINLTRLLNEFDGNTIPLGQVVPNFAMRAFIPVIEAQQDSDIVDNPDGPEEKYQDWAGGVPGIMASYQFDGDELHEILREANTAKQLCEDAWQTVVISFND